jgi:hypothetical protein
MTRATDAALAIEPQGEARTERRHERRLTIEPAHREGDPGAVTAWPWAWCRRPPRRLRPLPPVD